MVYNCCTSVTVDAEKCAKLRASKIENSLTTVKVMTKTKVAPFYLGHSDIKHSECTADVIN